MTPEGKVKAAVDKRLRAAKASGVPLWWSKPVVPGFGSPLLDYIGCARGRAFAIETKAGSGRLTPRQEALVSELRGAGCEVFIIRGPDCEGLLALSKWLEAAV